MKSPVLLTLCCGHGAKCFDWGLNIRVMCSQMFVHVSERRSNSPLDLRQDIYAALYVLQDFWRFGILVCNFTSQLLHQCEALLLAGLESSYHRIYLILSLYQSGLL